TCEPQGRAGGHERAAGRDRAAPSPRGRARGGARRGRGLGQPGRGGRSGTHVLARPVASGREPADGASRGGGVSWGPARSSGGLPAPEQAPPPHESVTDFSVVILVKDGARYLEELLAALSREGPSELLVIDSGSGDGSVEIARAADVEVLEIEPHEFGHGRTRNLGAGRASGGV